MHFQRTIAATCGVLLIGGVATGIWWGADINVKLQEKETSNQSLIQELRNSEAENEAKEIAHKSTVDELNKKLQEQEAVLVSREGFLAAIAEAKAVIAMAEGKVDSSAELTELVAAQDTVAAERKSATVVQEQAAKISAIAASLKTRVEAFDEEVRKASEVNTPQRQSTGGGSDTRGSGGQTATPKRSSGGANSNSGGGNPPAAKPSRATITSGPAREALNAVGGGWVELGSADVVCGYEWAAACSHPGGYIELKNLYVNESYDFWYPLLMHEYAHQVQYQHYEAMYYSGEYARLFGNDIEWLADCMTYQRVPWYQSGYGYSCSQEQLNYAAGAWNGRY